MPRVEILEHVPADEINQLEQDYIDIGAEVEKTPEDINNQFWTLTATFPDDEG